VTWATAPATDGPILATLGAVAKETWYEVDLTSLVAGDGTVGVAVTSGSSDGAGWSTREGPLTQRPQLVVECAAA
jgi:acid phosphatase type 7